jgi:ATPase family associated with various cellular activities (AAA)
MSGAAAAALSARARRSLTFDTGDPLVVLLGPGTSDVLVGPDYQERSLEESLWHVLRAAGFRRIVFSSANDPLYSLDHESLQLIRVLRAHAAPPATRMLDSSTVETLHACMSVRDLPTAVVISRAEEFLQFVSAHRPLAEWLANWSQATAAFENLCVLVFASRSLDSVAEIARSLGLSALLAYLDRQRSRRIAQPVSEIGEPDAAEMERIIHVARLRHGLRVADWGEFDRITGALAAQQGVLAVTWARRLRGLARSGTPLSEQALREHGWVEVLPSGQSSRDRLGQLTGLTEVKEHIDRLRWRAEAEAKRRKAGLLREADSLHLVFTGGPGTGKTTVARLVGELYREMGLLRRGHVHAPEAADLIGRYAGHTAVQTNQAVDAALDGVLFIDEAYRLSEQPGGFGQEAIDTLVTRMDNDRDRLVMIVAGYPDKMEAFLRSNPGLPRRFPRGNIIEFPDYQPDELLSILIGMLQDRGLSWGPDLEAELRQVVRRMHASRDETFGNAGEMRNLAQELETNWVKRVRADISEPLAAPDLPRAYRNGS